MKKTLKRYEVAKLIVTLSKMAEEESKIFSFFVTRNLNSLETHKNDIIEIEKLVQPTEKFKEYDEKRLELCEIYARKDSSGTFININGNYDFGSNLEKVTNLMTNLIDEYKDAVQEFSDIQIAYKDQMEEEIEVDLALIPFAQIPDNINFLDVEHIVKETPEEIEKIISG